MPSKHIGIECLRKLAQQPIGNTKYLSVTEAKQIVQVHERLCNTLADALRYIETYGGEVTKSYAAAGNLDDNKAFLESVR